MILVSLYLDNKYRTEDVNNKRQGHRPASHSKTQWNPVSSASIGHSWDNIWGKLYTL